MGSGLHELLASDPLLLPLEECHREANLREAAKWGQLARGFGWSATPPPSGPLVSGSV
jgi:hypothetical protein